MIEISTLRSHMQNVYFRWVVNILIAVVVCYSAEIGRQTGIKHYPLAFSVVWPAAGFSLAGLLLFGIKVWPGIFFGNFFYNFVHIVLTGNDFIAPLIATFAISMGSLLQAMFAYFIMQKYNSKGYFNTTRDIMIFLLPAGIMACFISSTIGITAISAYKGLPTDYSAWFLWMTFWIGDTLGVYIITPFIVVWLTKQLHIPLSKYKYEILYMLIAIFAISWLTVVYDFPLGHLFIPISLWVAYRFRLHGATLFLIYISLVTVIPTSLGMGAFSYQLISNQLLILVSFLEVITGTTLVVATMVNEREASWRIIQDNNIDLKEAMDQHVEWLKQLHDEMFTRKKYFESITSLTNSILKQIYSPLKQIRVSLTQSYDDVENLQKHLQPVKIGLQNELTSPLEIALNNLKTHLGELTKAEMSTFKVVKVIQEETAITAPGKLEVKSIDINQFLDYCLNQAVHHFMKRKKDFEFSVNKNYDYTIPTIFVLSYPLAYAFTQLITSSLQSMKQKQERKLEGYTPLLELRTIDYADKIEILIRDNGLGLTEEEQKHYLRSFIEDNVFTANGNFSLSLAQDIIRKVHDGEMRFGSHEGENLHIIIMLPKKMIN